MDKTDYVVGAFTILFIIYIEYIYITEAENVRLLFILLLPLLGIVGARMVLVMFVVSASMVFYGVLIAIIYFIITILYNIVS